MVEAVLVVRMAQKSMVIMVEQTAEHMVVVAVLMTVTVVVVVKVLLELSGVMAERSLTQTQTKQIPLATFQTTNVPVQISVTGGLHTPLFHAIIPRYSTGSTMPQFTLICTDEDSTVTTKEFEATVLDDVVDKTQDFLKGVGYCFEELRTQVYPIPEGNDDDIRSIYRDVD
jgi:hypothetical protein